MAAQPPPFELAEMHTPSLGNVGSSGGGGRAQPPPLSRAVSVAAVYPDIGLAAETTRADVTALLLPVQLSGLWMSSRLPTVVRRGYPILACFLCLFSAVYLFMGVAAQPTCIKCFGSAVFTLASLSSLIAIILAQPCWDLMQLIVNISPNPRDIVRRYAIWGAVAWLIACVIDWIEVPDEIEAIFQPENTDIVHLPGVSPSLRVVLHIIHAVNHVWLNGVPIMSGVLLMLLSKVLSTRIAKLSQDMDHTLAEAGTLTATVDLKRVLRSGKEATTELSGSVSAQAEGERTDVIVNSLHGTYQMLLLSNTVSQLMGPVVVPTTLFCTIYLGLGAAHILTATGDQLLNVAQWVLTSGLIITAFFYFASGVDHQSTNLQRSVSTAVAECPSMQLSSMQSLWLLHMHSSLLVVKCRPHISIGGFDITRALVVRLIAAAGSLGVSLVMVGIRGSTM